MKFDCYIWGVSRLLVGGFGFRVELWARGVWCIVGGDILNFGYGLRISSYFVVSFIFYRKNTWRLGTSEFLSVAVKTIQYPFFLASTKI